MADALEASEPLASALRPRTVDEFVGQSHILGPNKPLRRSIEAGRLHSMLFWGPPGVGKTTLANIVAAHSNAALEYLSAVMAGVKDIRAAVERAQQRLASTQQSTILFVDEVHRFNKAQQDAFLPFVEDGTITFLGATTENPSFELNNALLSRSRLYVLRPLSDTELAEILHRALNKLGPHYELESSALDCLVAHADGDARRVLNLLELALQLLEEGESCVGLTHVETVVQDRWRRFDKGGDAFYEQISALHKAVRGSSPDAALYWFQRMLDGGCDPSYIARRMLRMASEDIGNADPRALSLTLDAWQAFERLGSPEGELSLAQALLYLACAPKSNAVYQAFNKSLEEVRGSPSYDVPLHLRNAATRLTKSMGYGAEYRYAHDEEGAFAAGESYFPEETAGTRYYFPSDRGLEQKISAKLEYLRKLDSTSSQQRYAVTHSKEGDRK